MQSACNLRGHAKLVGAPIHLGAVEVEEGDDRAAELSARDDAPRVVGRAGASRVLSRRASRADRELADPDGERIFVAHHRKWRGRRCAQGVVRLRVRASPIAHLMGEAISMQSERSSERHSVYVPVRLLTSRWVMNSECRRTRVEYSRGPSVIVSASNVARPLTNGAVPPASTSCEFALPRR